MLKVLRGEVGDTVPATPHWWGLYKFQHAGIIDGYADEGVAWSMDAERLFEVDCRFCDDFAPDMLHLTTAASKLSPPDVWALRKEAAKLESKFAIDEYVDAISQTKQQVLDSGVFDHVRMHAQKYGDTKVIALNEGSDVAWMFDTHVGFEQGLIGLLEEPDNLQHYLSRLYDNTLERMQALAECGAHAFINSETYCSSDIMSPKLYSEIIFPVQQSFYKRLRQIGLIPIAYFTGDILPILADIKKLDICGLMVEESKKGFSLDVGEISDKLEGAIALFGNLDSCHVLERGTVDDVIAETKRQLRATVGKPFIMANGCPISFNTPAENIRAMLETTRNYK